MQSNRHALAWVRRHWERNAEIDPLWSIITRADKSQGRWDEAEFFTTGERLVDQHLKCLADSSVHYRTGRALDFGCGVGRLTRALGRHFNEVIGIDISEKMLSLARQLNEGQKNLQFIHNEAPDLRRFQDRSFDLVYCMITLQHMPAALSQEYLREFLRVLDSNGIALVQIVNRKTPGLWYWPPSLAKRLWRMINGMFLLRAHMEMHVLSEEKVREVAAASGAKILEAWIDDSSGGRFESRIFVFQRQ